MPIEHYMMFGTFAEQRHFIYPAEDTYNGVIFNANMVAHAPGGLAGFLVSRTQKLSFIIDPLTHAFQHAPRILYKADGSGTKKAIQTLADLYGEPVASRAGKDPVTPSDFLDGRTKELFVQNCLKFQREEVTNRARNHDDCKYFTEDELSGFDPKALVAPYFFLSEGEYGDWLTVNTQLAAIAVQMRAGSEAIYAEIVIDKALLVNQDAINKIVEQYSTVELDGYLLWVDQFSEHDASQTELQGLLDFCRSLRDSGRSVINLHGSYFSVLAAGTLGKAALTGVTHGPEFGEARGVIPVGGGIPFAKYYLPILHQRVLYREMLKILDATNWRTDAATFHANVCDCPVCLETIDGNIENFSKFGESTPIQRRSKSGIVRIDYPTQEARLRCLKHFLQCKEREFKSANNDATSLIEDLDKGVRTLRNIIGYEGIKHLLNWKVVLSQ